MGMNPMADCKFIRLAHEAGLGCGDTRDIEIMGDAAASAENWNFAGPFKKMTFASKMQHKIYWGGLKKPVEWSLKTWLAPWAYIASVIYHDFFWYPFKSKGPMTQCLKSEWGRLFQNWGKVKETPEGFPEVGRDSPRFHRNVSAMLSQSMRVLNKCFWEAPEMCARRRRKALEKKRS
jgi:hypothetical protein